MLELSDEQKRFLASDGHCLVQGGPGSGKTTVAILKADALVQEILRSGQKVLFLSFARATVSRVIEAVDEHATDSVDVRKRIVVDTYHSFFWRAIRAHGYLLGLPRRLEILLPTGEAIALAPIRNDYGPIKGLSAEQLREKQGREVAERQRLAFDEGKVCFDMFGGLTAELLQRGGRIRSVISSAFPVIILDEFQDTNANQWTVVSELGRQSRLIALADPEQRIYDFAGADPERVNHFRGYCEPGEFDFESQNFRSPGTDITAFGNDLLTGKFRDDPYHGLHFFTYPANQNQALSALKGQVLQSRKRLIDGGRKRWSLAILVPTKKLMRQVSDYLREPQGSMPAVSHRAAIDMEGAILAAEVIAFLLQPKLPKGDFRAFVRLLCDFFLGKGGGTPTKTDLSEADRIIKALERALEARRAGRSIPGNSVIRPILAVYRACREIEPTGDPDKDWLAVRDALHGGDCKRLKVVAAEARNLRLLDRGTQLRDALSNAWRRFGCYQDALEIVRQSFIQDHFAMSGRVERGVVVMNMHKAKGKQFDEVIVFEGWPIISKGKIVANSDRIVRGNDGNQNLASARQNFRVSVTRAKLATTVLTPKEDPCVLLVNGS